MTPAPAPWYCALITIWPSHLPYSMFSYHLCPQPPTPPPSLHNLHIPTFVSIPCILLHLLTLSTSHPPSLCALQISSTCFPTIHSLHNSFHHASSTPHHNYFPFSPFILASSAPHPSPHPSHPIHLPSTPLIPTTCSLSSTPSARSGGIPRSHISRLFTMRSTYLGLSMLHDSSMNADEVFTSSLADIPDRFVHPSRLVSEAM